LRHSREGFWISLGDAAGYLAHLRETDEQWSLLRKLKCDRAQGFRFSAPLPAGQFARFGLDRSGEVAETLREKSA
jgi:hypothetical protein